MADISQIKLPSGDTFDIIDEKSGYITAQYIENKTDYSIPVSRVGEIVVGETAIGTDSTNFPTSKAVVDYVDERVVQEIDAIDVGVTSVNGKTGSVTLSASDVGAATTGYVEEGINWVQSQIPTSTSQLTNDSGFLEGETTNSEGDVLSISLGGNGTTTVGLYTLFSYNNGSTATFPLEIQGNGTTGQVQTKIYGIVTPTQDDMAANKKYVDDKVGAISVPSKTSDLTNDSGYLTASDIASVLTYKGTKASYSALPSSGNSTGDVWHITDTGAEWAWDGSAWQELGTAIDLSGYATKATTLAGYGITDAKIQNGTITLGSNSITPLTSFTETDPVFTASPAHGIAASDITNWNGKTAVSIVRW